MWTPNTTVYHGEDHNKMSVYTSVPTLYSVDLYTVDGDRDTHGRVQKRIDACLI